MGERKYYHLTNKLMFAIVMRDEELCAELLERIFDGRKIERIRFQVDEVMDELRERVYHDEICKTDCSVEVEKTIITGLHSKSVRLDVLFKDDEAWYDIEMQVEREQYLPQRSRYYHAAMTVDSTNIGIDYENLKKSFVIFICLFDYFKTGEPVYTIHMRTEENGLPFDDGQTTILINMKCAEHAIPARLRSFYDYVNEGRVAEEDDFIRKIQERTNCANRNQEVYRYMTFEEEYIMKTNRLEKIIKKREEQIAAIEAEVAAMDAELANKEAEVAAMDAELANKEAEVAAKDAELANKEAEVAAKDAELANKEAEVAAKDAELTSKKTEMDAFNRLVQVLLEKNRIADLQRASEDMAYRKTLLEEFQLI